ncbi:MAG: NADH-quinone oxidoreductase subunit NuoB [Methanotrichaceae archaeon]|nr:NADH-quinone oxidoreductase subunit NuoB [Methanotrichaceae archaeon]
MGISDVIPVPVAIDEELEKWTIFGQPVADVWFTTTEKIHQIIEMGPIKNIFNWGRKNSVYFLMQPMGCCGVEMFVFGAAPYDSDRFGCIPRNTPRQTDVMIMSGYITRKYLPVFKNLWEQMPEPKWCIAIGECAISGGPFYDSYNIIQNTADYFPIDVFIPGCPPRPEQFLEGLMQLQEKIKQRKDKRGYY